jgi:Xylose isomerase-like TIM barrel
MMKDSNRLDCAHRYASGTSREMASFLALRLAVTRSTSIRLSQPGLTRTCFIPSEGWRACLGAKRSSRPVSPKHSTRLRHWAAHAFRDGWADARRQCARTLYPVYIDQIHWAAVEAAKQGIDILVEPINTRDMPGFFLDRQEQAHQAVEDAAVSNLKVQMDLYHCQIVEGDIAMKLRRYLPTGKVGHIHIAGVPERHEPDLGELHHPYLFALLEELLWRLGRLRIPAARRNAIWRYFSRARVAQTLPVKSVC